MLFEHHNYPSAHKCFPLFHSQDIQVNFFNQVCDNSTFYFRKGIVVDDDDDYDIDVVACF